MVDRDGLRPWVRNRVVLVAAAPALLLAQVVYVAALGAWEGLRDGVNDIKQAWRILGR